jgi:hypothetical protein
MVSTWNEWLEDTAIEPAVQYGDEYLQLTRQYADQLQGADSLPPVGQTDDSNAGN